MELFNDEYKSIYDKVMMNLIIAKDKDIEYYQDIFDFISDCNYDSDPKSDDKNNKCLAFIKFCNKYKDQLNHNKNIFIENSGIEIFIDLQFFYQEVMNESDE